MARSTIDSLAVHPCNPGYPRVDFLLPSRLIYLPKPWWRLIHKSSLTVSAPLPYSCTGYPVHQLNRAGIFLSLPVLSLLPPLCKLEKPFQVRLDVAKRYAGSPTYYKGQRKPVGALNFLTLYLRDIPVTEKSRLLVSILQVTQSFCLQFCLRRFRILDATYLNILWL